MSNSSEPSYCPTLHTLSHVYIESVRRLQTVEIKLIRVLDVGPILVNI